jgi:hypothetical protein
MFQQFARIFLKCDWANHDNFTVYCIYKLDFVVPSAFSHHLLLQRRR